MNVSTFLNEAPNKDYLLIKVATIMSITGACRTAELVDMRIGHIEDRGSVLVVNIPDTKTKKPKLFTVVDDERRNTRYLQLYKMYKDLRPKKVPHKRFLLHAVGKDTFSKVPKLIAEFLQLPDFAPYTGHCFRRSSASFLVDGGGDLLTLRNHGRWKSSIAAEGYNTSFKEDFV